MKRKIYMIIAAYALLSANCTESTIIDEKINVKASLPQNINFTKQGFKVISLLINKKVCTMATLYGNDIAVKAALSENKILRSGFQMALVTWQQRPSPYWFGDNIPDRLQSVELIKTDPVTDKLIYEKYGSTGAKIATDNRNVKERISYMLNIKPSVLP